MHHAKTEEIVRKAKIAGALWFTENTIKRYPNVVPYLEWFGTKDDDERTESSNCEFDGDGQA